MKHLIVTPTLLSVVVSVLLAGCAFTRHISKGTGDRPPLELKHDRIDVLTGEALDADGHVPPRTNETSTPSYALLPTERLWQEIMKSKNYTFVAVKSPKQTRGFYQGKLLIAAGEVAEIKSTMLSTIRGLLEARGDGPEFKLPQTVTGMVFPGFFAKIETLTALTELRGRRDLDYIEPLYYEMILQSGCGYEPYVASSMPWLQDETKYSGTSTDVVPYTFRHLGITKAWNRFPRPGEGIMVAVLDTGVSLTQDQLQGRFIVGRSAGATHLDSTGTGFHDACGHGTKVAGILAAPNDGRNIVGALYAADLTTVKVGHAPAQDVFSGSGWVCDGIAKAIKSGAKVVNMSFGFLISSPTVEACIRSAFDNTTVIFVAAAGTGPQGGVIFPANMNREVIAISAVDIDGPATYHMIGGAQTTSVAYGQDVDFASAYAANRMPSPGEIGTESYVGQMVGNGFPPGVVGQPYTQFAAGGGTSSATPTLSAIFGLTIQSQLMPTTRADIIAQVARASTIVNVRNADGSQIASGYIGAGIPNAYVASGGSSKVDMLVSPGDIVTVGQSFTLTAAPDGRSPLRYSWGAGGGGQTKNFTAPSTPGPFTVNLHVTDDMDPTLSLNVSKTVTVVAGPVPPPTTRTLSSVEVVYMNASFPVGGRGDFRVNQGWSMPAGCVVLNREAHLQYAVGGVIKDRPDLNDMASADYGGLGFSVSKPAGVDPESLDTLVHLWHDAPNSVYVRVKYTIRQPAGVLCDVPGHTQ